MPATTERPRPTPIPSLLDEPVPSRRRSPPSYPKLQEPKNIASPPSSIPSTPKPVLSAKSEQKPPLSPPPEPEPEPKKALKAEAKKPEKLEIDKVDKSEPKLDTKPEVKEPEESKPIIDMETFQQILELDDDGGDEFSREMVYAYFTQAESTFQTMDEAFKEKNLAELASLGHFLKGSSAALGVWKVQASCEKIQHFGQLRDEETGATLTSKDALERIERLLSRVKAEYGAAEKWLKVYYKDGSS